MIGPVATALERPEMPHITLEYSANIEQPVDFHAFFHDVHIALQSLANIPIGNCKSRARACEAYHIADGSDRHAFVHLEIRFLEGRAPDIKSAISKQVLQILDALYAPTLTEFELQLTVEVNDIARLGYSKTPAGTLSDPTQPEPRS